MAKIILRCEKLIEGERCIHTKGHKGKCEKHWITQKEINKRLEACGYGCSMYPNNWWSKKDLTKIETLMNAVKILEKAIGRKITPFELSCFKDKEFVKKAENDMIEFRRYGTMPLEEKTIKRLTDYCEWQHIQYSEMGKTYGEFFTIKRFINFFPETKEHFHRLFPELEKKRLEKN